LAHVVSSLAYPNLLGNKMLGCCCCYCSTYWSTLQASFTRAKKWVQELQAQGILFVRTN
jgi:hypothetical protein